MTKQMTKLTNKELRVRALNSHQLTRCSKIEQGISYRKVAHLGTTSFPSTTETTNSSQYGVAAALK